MFPIGQANSAMVESNPYYNSFSPLHFHEAFPHFQQLNSHYNTLNPSHSCPAPPRFQQSNPYHNTLNAVQPREASPQFQQPDPYAGSANVHTTFGLHGYGVSPYDPQPLPHDGRSGIGTMSSQDGVQTQHPLQAGDDTVESASTLHQTSPASASKEDLIQNTPQQTAYASGSGTQHHSHSPNSLRHSVRPKRIGRKPPRQEWDPSYRLVHTAIDEEEAANRAAFKAHQEYERLQIRLRDKYKVYDPTVDMMTWLDSSIDLPGRRGQYHSKFKQTTDWRLLLKAIVAEKAADTKFKEKHEAAAQLHRYAVDDTEDFED
ncbi:hypothetical protein HBI56_222060 [Parastagonospora nodorum]|uniref:Uncharacterized protein n=1 Tax=Phaeosphaeria nodorum (strain SN15 / ATCC MYA-4574 / FGSC 10173) TaxID=321614 RepID=A0A7U2IDH1_PHANO|nr:hypothetical protein HBH56_231990 [Parastagonospora nodorum]QRD07763.1 hypothetical protein JI435_161870 [Parastagonospora nodorum SN15]KAH3921406.1 hypothetical protein HBH54_241090 [Parastagonospora nodorum]KAH3956958.1 hypothetical protein HBH51_231710 [Parastagonospora nodorum]KAH3967411.1 hypothetical protein HBH52_189780 [Parastagonospora nodorum]